MMLSEYEVSCTPRQFAAWARELPTGYGEQPAYIVDREDEYGAKIHFGYLKYKAMSTWVGDLGRADVDTMGGKYKHILTVYCHNSIWDKVSPVWQRLFDVLTMQGFIIAPVKRYK